MPEGRPAIPVAIQRAVKVEAGHRCAIPTCKSTPVELAHIVPWEKIQEHTFENLIALCPTCHTRFDSGQIDRLSMKQYKANLGVISGRYGEMERRLLDVLAANQAAGRFRLALGSSIQLMYLVKDGLLKQVPINGGMFIDGQPMHEEFEVTPLGRDFVAKWIDAQPVSDDARPDLDDPA